MLRKLNRQKVWARCCHFLISGDEQSTPVIADTLGEKIYEIICKSPRSIVVSTILYFFKLWTIKEKILRL